MQPFESWDELYGILAGSRILAVNRQKVSFFTSDGVLVESRLGRIPGGSHSLLDIPLPGWPPPLDPLENFVVGHAFLSFDTIALRTGTVHQTTLNLVSDDEPESTRKFVRFMSRDQVGPGFIHGGVFAAHLERVTAKELLQQAYRSVKNGGDGAQ